MRFYIIFGITIILCFYMIVINPFDKYLGIYKDDFFIEYDVVEKGYHWIYESNDVLNVEQLSDLKWKLNSNKNGKSIITFKFINDNDPDDIKYTIVYNFDIKFKNIFWTLGEAYGLDSFPNPYKV